jgi:hypothetical protein
MIYGNGKGLFNKISTQITYIHVMLKMQRAMVVGAGDGVWNHVHIEDLADLYTLVVRDILGEQWSESAIRQEGDHVQRQRQAHMERVHYGLG